MALALAMIALDPFRSVALLLILPAVPAEVKDVSDESKFFRADKLLEVLCLEPLTTDCTVSLLTFEDVMDEKLKAADLTEAQRVELAAQKLTADDSCSVPVKSNQVHLCAKPGRCVLPAGEPGAATVSAPGRKTLVQQLHLELRCRAKRFQNF